MRTDVQVGGKKVVAVALGEVETSLTLIDKHTIGNKQEQVWSYQGVKGLSSAGKHQNFRSIGSKRKKCAAIFLDRLDPELCDQIQSGMFNTYM